MNKKTVIIYFLVFAALIFAIIVKRQEVSKRYSNSEFTNGQIINKGKRAKGEKYVAYKFVVNSKEYSGTVNIDYCKKCKRDCCTIGAIVKVRYEKNNPSNNDLVY